MKILVTGQNGQVGQALIQHLSDYNIMAVSRDELDLSKPLDISKILKRYQPDIIINAAAYTAVDKAESNKNLAYKVNSDSVFELAKYARQNNCILYHYSTDYVFDGQSNHSYIETDITNPLNVYGKTKLKAEHAIITSGCDYCIFRTSWIYSVNGHNFINTIRKLLLEKKVLNIVNDQIGAPTSAQLIAQTTLKALEKNLSSGIYHLTTSNHTSWYDFAKHIEKYFYNESMSDRIKPINTKNYPFLALRPLNSRLNTQKLEYSLKEKFPDWQDEFHRIFKNNK